MFLISRLIHTLELMLKRWLGMELGTRKTRCEQGLRPKLWGGGGLEIGLNHVTNA